MRKLIVAIAFTVASFVPLPAAAMNTFGTDLSDLWWNPNESGWGANLSHQGEIVFLTLFVYGADNKVRWYSADALRSQGGANLFTFVGPLYETTGPYLGGAFNPSTVVRRQVGTATLVMAVEVGTLTYSVDGVFVTKAIERNTFRANNLAGSYIGGASGAVTGCGANSGSFEGTAIFVINHAGSTITVGASLDNGITCAYTGTYSQHGRMGRITGTFACTSGSSGTYSAGEIEAGYQGFFARYVANYGSGCVETGRIGGLKR